MRRQRQLEWERIVDDISSAGADDLGISAECISLGLPAVPARSDENFFVEAEIFHFDSSHNSRLRLFNDDVLEWNVAGF